MEDQCIRLVKVRVFDIYSQERASSLSNRTVENFKSVLTIVNTLQKRKINLTASVIKRKGCRFVKWISPCT
eukprot:8165738-Ditylum_brightwellii.AAC.1